MPNLTNRWLLIALASLTLTSCAKSVAQNNQVSTDANTTKQSETSNPQPKQVEDVDPKVPIYEVTWEFCADKPGVIIDADENNCVRSSRPIYVWTSDSRENLDYSPEVLLWRQTIPTYAIKTLGYSVVVDSYGCFPTHREPGQQAYYSADRTIHIDKEWANNQITIKANATARRVDSTEEAKQIVARYKAGNSLASFGENCRLRYEQQ